MSTLFTELRDAALRVQKWNREHSDDPSNLTLLIRGRPDPVVVVGLPEAVKGGLLRIQITARGATLLTREDEVQGFVAYLPEEPSGA